MKNEWVGKKLYKKIDTLIRILTILIFLFPNLAMQYGSASAETNKVLQEETGTPSVPPTITVLGELAAFTSIVDSPSEAQSYQVSGSALVSDLIITPPEGFQISLTNEDGFIDYPDTLTLTPASDGSLAETSVYVRLNSSTTGQYAGDILHTSENAQEVALSVIGQVDEVGDKTPVNEETETPESLPVTGSSDVIAQAATTVNFTADEMLGKPTDTSITINVVPESSIVYKYQYGTSSGGYTGETAEVTATGGSPSETVISGLLPNTKYYYRMEYHIPSETEWATRTEHTFETQRASGSSFVFTVTSDSHDQGTFTSVDNNILSEAPDFHVDLGDTFMIDNLTTQNAVDAKYLKIRGTGYFGNIGSSVPIFLSSGNHENEEGWNLDDTFSLAQASIQARKKYFPTPINNSIYTGNTDPLTAIDASVYGDQYREDYYAWTWGDALFIVIDPFQYTMTNPYGSTAGEGTDDPASGDQWNWTLGQQQYNWLKSTLENSDAKYKFVFSHQMVGGKPTGDSSSPATYVRGGAEAAGYFEWGGKDASGNNIFSTKRPSMPKTIEQLFEDNGVSAYFHGHDHQYVYEKRSGIVYQEVPSPTMTGSGFNDYTEGTYTDFQTIKKLPSGGHLKITVTSSNATVDYISTGGAVNYSYTIDPAGSDTTPPNVTITQASGQTDPTSASPVNFSATFSESVSDFTSSDVTLSGTAGAATAVVTGSGSSYNVAVSGMTSSGTVIASINAGVAHDSSSNANTASINTDNTVTYSTSSSSGAVTLDGAVGSGGTASSGSSLSFSHTTGTGTNRLMLVGVSWNCGTAATPPSISSITFTYGTTVLDLSQEYLQPTNTSTVANKRYSAIWYSPTEPPAGTTGTIKITFSASVTSGIAANAVNFAGVDLTTPFSTSNGAYSTSSNTPSVTLSPLNGDEMIFDNLFVGGTTVPTVGSSQTKLWGVNGGNAISAASIMQATGTSATMSWSSSSAVTWASAAVAINPGEDAIPPSVTINQATSQVDPTSAHTINFSVVFSEAVTDFATGDVSLGGTAGATTATVTGSGTTYNVAVTGMTTSGTVIASLAAGVAHDSAGNASLASTTTDNQVSYVMDTTSPTVTINQASGQTDPASAPPVNFTVVFSEPVTDFATGDVTINGTAGATTATVTGSGSTYNVAITGMTGSGTVLASLAAGVAHDEAGNSSIASSSTDNQVTYIYAVVTQDGAVSSTSAASGSTLSFGHTTGTGSNRLMLVGVSWNCLTSNPAPTISSMNFTYGSTILDLAQEIVQETNNGTASNKRYSAIWFSPTEPPSGTTGTVNITFTGSVTNGIAAGAVNFAGVNQSTPFGTANSAFATSGTAPTVTLTGLTGNELIFDNVFMGASSSSQTLAPAASSGQTQLWIPAYVANLRGSASTKPASGSSSVTMSWTAGSSAAWAIAAVPIIPNVETISHTLEISASPSGGGSTNPTVGTHTYSAGAEVDITATSASGYEFTGWSGDCSGTSTCHVTMDADKSVTANFALITKTLTVAVSPTGSGTTSPTVGTHTYTMGTGVDITAEAASGYTFTGWSGACTGTGSCHVTMNEDKTVTANFETINKTLTVVVVPALGGTTSPTAGTHTYAKGTGVDITATPASGYTFTGWTGDCSGSATCHVTMDADKSVTANFVAIDKTLTVEVTPTGGGSTDPSIGTHVYTAGTGVDITATPASGYTFTGWSGACSGTATCHVTMDADKTVTANFETINKTLSIAVTPSGGGSTDPVAGTHIYTTGTTVDITATAVSGYEFTGWSGDCSGTGTCHLVMNGDKSVTASFALITKVLTVAVTPTGGGTTSPVVGTHTYNLNTGVDITATASTGYEFTGWTGACTGTGTCHVTMDGDKTVTANFALTTKTLTMAVTPTGGGTTTPTVGTHTYSYGTGVDVTATPATGYTFTGWAGACTGTGSCHVTMDGDKTVTANFTLINETLTISAAPSAGGTTSPSVGTHTYTYGTGVDITATPADGYYLSSWSGACTGTGICHVTMDGDKTVTANFASATTTFTGKELLGRPEATSITVSAVPDTAITLRYQYGTSTGTYSNQTTAVSATAGQPQVVTISGLTPNTKYFYRMQYSKDGGTTWVNRAENSFWTQRSTGSTFSFTITSDAHVNIMLGNSTNWTNTLNTIKGEGGDFDIDLGDTAAMDNGSSSVALGDTAAAEQKYKDTLPYFNIISGSSPIFLVAGNHEQQEAWHLQGTLANSLPIMGKNAEKKYFLNPVPDSFYSGDATTLADLSGDHLKQDYYAWTWGDALFVVISPYWTSTSKPYTTSAGGGESDSTGTGNGWDWTLGQTQFNWLKSTLQGSTAKYKFIFTHQLVSSDNLSGQEYYGHGGVDAANLYEMGGYNLGGSVWGWDTNRSGWGTKPIHQLLVDNGVTAFFHGHDHAYAYEKMDGVVYQAVPSASFTGTFSIYTNGGNGGKTIQTYQNPGHLLVTVGPSTTKVDYIQSGSSSITYSYTMAPVSTDKTLTVAVTPTGGGTTSPTVGTHTYALNSEVDVTAVAASGYEFTGWTGACTGTGTCHVTMDGDKAVTANFTSTDKTLTVAVTPSGGGTTSPAVGTHTYALNTGVDITAAAASGYTFTGWTGACTGTGTCHVTMDGNKTVTANFATTNKILTVVATPSEGGSTSPTVGTHMYTPGTGVDVTAAAASGYTFTGWSGDCTGTGICHVTMDTDKTVTANFTTTSKTLTVAVTPSGGGTTSPTVGAHTYTTGTGVDITATPADGYYLSSWSGACTGTGTCHVTMDADKTVTANFTSATTTFTGTELLGRPEATSITVSAVPDTAITLRYQYGTSTGTYSNQTTAVSASAGQPQVVTISGLSPNTKYYYRMQYSKDGGTTWVNRAENSFWTQRSTGSTFSFTITSDAHVNIMLGNSTNWTNTLNTIKGEGGDFDIDLGDTAAMDNGSSSVALGDTAAAEQKYKDTLPYFNIISGSSPIFLVAGNHEQQEAWHLQGTLANSLPIMGKNAEKKYFLNPVPDSFYSGDATTLADLSGDHLKQDYYAWTWGDALFVVISPYWTSTSKPYTTSTGGGETDTTGTDNRWDWTLGQTQFNWLKSTLQGSTAKYKFVFAHQMVGGNSLTNQVNYGHGGVDSANLVEWGGYNVGGSVYGWDTNRPGWGTQPIGQLLEANNVTAFFHGHDHTFAYEKLNNVVYQAVPSASFTGNFNIYTAGGNDGKTIAVSQDPGHLLVTVGPDSTTVKYIKSGSSSVSYTYSMNPATVNNAPTNIALSSATIAENSASGSTVGSLTSTDPDAGNTFTYSLVTGTGDTDNSSFSITGNTLQTAVAFDYETKSSYTVRIRTTDQGSLYYEKAFTISVTDVNEAPTNITLSSATVAENSASGTTVGSLTTADPDTGNTFTYSLVSGTGGTDNSSFSITGNTLKTAAVFDYETKSSYSVRIRAADQGTLNYEKAFTISVTNVNEAPVAVDDTAGTNVNAALSITAATLKANDTDADNSNAELSVTAVSNPTNGTVNLVSGTITFTPTFDFVGTAGFDYTVSDGSLTDTGHVTVTVSDLTFTLAVTLSGTGTGVVTSSDTFINCGSTCSRVYKNAHTVTLTAAPTTGGYHRFAGWSGGGCTGTGTCVVSMTAARSVTANFEKATFADVPFDHPRWAYIQALYENGLTAGCSTDPLMFCPDKTMTRGESAAFLMRGLNGEAYVPPAVTGIFTGDDWSDGSVSWAEKWAEALYNAKLTSGCGTDPLSFCPAKTTTRIEGATFGEALYHNGVGYTVPPATGTVFFDMTDTGFWGTKYAELAYADGLIPAWSVDPGSGKPIFSPDTLLDRSWAAYIIVKAKDLTLPE